MKKKEITIEDLAIMTQKGFIETRRDIEILSKSFDKRFDAIDRRFDRINIDLKIKGKSDSLSLKGGSYGQL